MSASFEPHALRLRDSGITAVSSRLALGRMLRAARILCGFEQADVSDDVRMTTDTISKLERGLTLPNHRTVSALVLYYEGKGVRFYPHEGAVSLPEDLRRIVAGDEVSV